MASREECPPYLSWALVTCLYVSSQDVHENRILADSGGTRDPPPPHPVQFLSFSCSFRGEKIAK